ncbi:MAG TPA: hypothetical protein VKS78_04240, partial [Roseiarcus sp.]|nr:hypothetical protein [Roseiarcus sp.]
GLAAEGLAGPFDRIIVHALIDEPAARLGGLLAAKGVLVAARAAAGEGGGEQRIVRFTREGEGPWLAEDMGAARSFAPLAEGVTRGS